MRALILLTVCLLAAAPRAWATDTELKPSEVFATDAPSIVLIKSFDKAGKAIALGSGVVIAKDTVVSNCHVVEKAATASVFYQHKQLAAKLLYADVEHDLCSFTVKGLSAPPVRMGSTSQVKVGDAAYAIGAPEGLELTLSGGLISSLRHIPDGVVLQMTTPISPGSSGGGLFDSHARLIGITSYYMAQGEQLNFAIPVEWINELLQRGKLTTANTQHIGSTSNATQESSFQKGFRAFQAGDYNTAFEILEPFAKQGNAVAQDILGWMYTVGKGVTQDYAKAAAWFLKAAEQGDADGQYDLGNDYYLGRGVPQDYALAIAWHRKAADQGNAAAQFNFGLYYEQGKGVPQNHAKAVALIRKAADQGYAAAQYVLGVFYDNGKGVPQDYSQLAYHRTMLRLMRFSIFQPRSTALIKIRLSATAAR